MPGACPPASPGSRHSGTISPRCMKSWEPICATPSKVTATRTASWNARETHSIRWPRAPCPKRPRRRSKLQRNSCLIFFLKFLPGRFHQKCELARRFVAQHLLEVRADLRDRLGRPVDSADHSIGARGPASRGQGASGDQFLARRFEIGQTGIGGDEKRRHHVIAGRANLGFYFGGIPFASGGNRAHEN